MVLCSTCRLTDCFNDGVEVTISAEWSCVGVVVQAAVVLSAFVGVDSQYIAERAQRERRGVFETRTTVSSLWPPNSNFEYSV